MQWSCNRAGALLDGRSGSKTGVLYGRQAAETPRQKPKNSPNSPELEQLTGEAGRLDQRF